MSKQTIETFCTLLDNVIGIIPKGQSIEELTVDVGYDQLEEEVGRDEEKDRRDGHFDFHA